MAFERCFSPSSFLSAVISILKLVLNGPALLPDAVYILIRLKVFDRNVIRVVPKSVNRIYFISNNSSSVERKKEIFFKNLVSTSSYCFTFFCRLVTGLLLTVFIV